MVIVSSTKHSEIIFVSLDEVIVVHMGHILIYIESFDFKKLFSRFVKIVLSKDPGL